MRTLRTERLILKEYKEDYAEGLYKYASNPNVGPRAGWKPHESVEESLKIIRELFMPVSAWAIFLKETGDLIGTIALEDDRFRPDARSKELGYSLAYDYWGKGYMTEAARKVIEFAFNELELQIMCICTSTVNTRSQRIIEKCGFKLEGVIRMAYQIYDGSLRDSMEFSMTKEEWETNKGNQK